MPFEPFSVQCLTCGSRLRVTDPGIVGTIAACPRCQSMVSIQRPANQVAVGASDVDSQAITEDSIAAPGEAETTAAEDQAHGFSGGEHADSPAADPNHPDQVWQSERTRRSRQIALVVACSLSGLLFAAALFGWFVHHYRKQNADLAGRRAQLDAAGDGLDAADSGEGDDTTGDENLSPGSGDTGSEGPGGDGPEPDANDDRGGSTDGDADEGDPPADSDRGGEQDVADAPTGRAAQPENMRDDGEANGATGQQPPADGADEPDSVANDLIPTSPIVGGGSREEDAEDEAPPPMTELPPGLAEFGVFLEEDGPVDLRPTQQAPPTLDEIDIDAAAGQEIDAMTRSTPIETVDVRADLSIQLAFDSDGYRLADLMLLISQLTGVPIQIDWVSFDLIGRDLHEPIPTPRTKLISARDLLGEIARALGGELQIEESMVVITPTDAIFEDRLRELTDLSDFGPGSRSAVAVLNEFLGDEVKPTGDSKPTGEAETTGGDSGDRVGDEVATEQTEPLSELKIGPTREDKQFAMLATETLRRMRGLEAKTPRPLLGHWAQTEQARSIDWPLLSGGQTGPQRSEPLSVAGLVRKTARSNAASAVIHWPDAVRRHLSPTELLLPHAGADAASMLRGVLKPYGLQIRRVDSQRWWIGAAATYDRAKVLVWTEPLGDRAESLKERIAAVMATRDSFRVTFDPASGRAIMLLPRYIVRQLPKIQASVAAR